MLPANRKPKQADIIAAQKIIADISSGLYRSPAAALKELVSNSYDADADNVIITTDAPNFRVLTIEDDATGMNIDTFLEIMNHIGGSRKRLEGDRSPVKGRKLIGRIGIGMLAVAQLGNRFYVSSSRKGTASRFIAEVNLEPFHRDDVALKSMGKLRGEGKVQIGAVKYVDNIPELPEVQYTVITVPDAKKGLISEMTSSVRRAVGAKEILSINEKTIKDFDELIDVVRSSKRADLVLDGYYYMLWELGLLSPVNYSTRGLFDAKQRNIENLSAVKTPEIRNFRVTVDGIEVRRPQLFPNTSSLNYSSPDPKVYTLNFDRQIAGRRLRFNGYIYSQQPRIDPEELKGVHIRIRDVGIGKYDKSWLGYPFDEGIKFGQITGEIYVDEGLEPALNIDRDSFRETDVHYQAMRAYIWDILRSKVFPEFKARGGDYRKVKKKEYHVEYDERLGEAILGLPAPLIEQAEVVKSVSPSISNWIEVTDSNIRVKKSNWDKFADENGLTGETRERFLRVLSVLISSELLVDWTEEEVEPFLKALAIAIQ